MEEKERSKFAGSGHCLNWRFKSNPIVGGGVTTVKELQTSSSPSTLRTLVPYPNTYRNADFSSCMQIQISFIPRGRLRFVGDETLLRRGRKLRTRRRMVGEDQMKLGLFLCWMIFMCSFFHVGDARGGRIGRNTSYGHFNVKKFGARGDGRLDDSKAFLAAWNAACRSTGNARLQIPKGTYLLGPVQFKGPCKNVASIVVQMQGTLIASTNLGKFGDNWIQFGWVDGLTLTGGGTFDGQGASAWPQNKCPKEKNCKTLPINIKFVSTSNTMVRGITSLNSKFFHIALVDCTNFKARGIRIKAPANSPNTDGIHIERSSRVDISQASIGTGDDCISIGQGNSQVSISKITCGPGHGISVGSLGRYSYEKDVQGLIVRDSTLTGTMNGLRIKTWANSPGSTVAKNMTFENIVMNNVGNPIIIDQTYCPYVSCKSAAPSRVKIRDITFKNIRGTSSTPVAVTFQCSKGIPCQNINLHDVHLDYTGGGARATSTCANAKVSYSGTQIPPPCV